MKFSECGKYGGNGAPFTKTKKNSDKSFPIWLGNVAPANNVVELNLPLRKKARTGHTVLDVTNNLISMNQLAKDNYITIFGNNKVSTSYFTNTEVSVSRWAVSEACQVKKRVSGKFCW